MRKLLFLGIIVIGCICYSICSAEMYPQIPGLDRALTDDDIITTDLTLEDNLLVEGTLGVGVPPPTGGKLYVQGDVGITEDLTVGATATISNDLTLDGAGSSIFFPDGTSQSTAAGAGTGDMLKTVYDTNTNNVVDSAEGLADTDYGDFTVSGGSATLDTGVVAGNEIASTAVSVGSYTNTDLTVDDDGRITAASSGSGTGEWTDTGSDVYPSELDNVAIGCQSVPGADALYVEGAVGIATNLTVGGTITGDVTGDLTGTASDATVLETARTIAGVSFNGSANIAIASTGLSDTAALLYETELDDFSEAQAQISNKTLVNEEDAVAWDSAHTFSAGITITGSASMTEDLTVGGTTHFSGIPYRWPVSDGTSAQVLHTDATGSVYWDTDDSAAGGEWTDLGTIVHPNESTTDNVAIGGTTSSAPIYLKVGGDAIFSSDITTSGSLYTSRFLKSTGTGSSTIASDLTISSDLTVEDSYLYISSGKRVVMDDDVDTYSYYDSVNDYWRFYLNGTEYMRFE